MSPGRISGVNWIRLQDPPIDLARAFARDVFPRPGTSSISRCSSENRQVSTRSRSSCLPLIALFNSSERLQIFKCTTLLFMNLRMRLVF